MAETPLLEEDAEEAWEVLVFGVDEHPPTAEGDAEDAAWFKAQLVELGFTQRSFAEWMKRCVDDRSRRAIRTSIQRICAGQAPVPSELPVLFFIMLRSKKRKMARQARLKAERQPPDSASEQARLRDERDAPWNDPPESRDDGAADAAAASGRGPPATHLSEPDRHSGPGHDPAPRRNGDACDGRAPLPASLSEPDRASAGAGGDPQRRAGSEAIGRRAARPPAMSSEPRGEGGPGGEYAMEAEGHASGEPTPPPAGLSEPAPDRGR
jgi:hypothetical protein